MVAVPDFFYCLKICPGVHGSHGEIRLSIPFPYVVSRSPRFVHGGLKRGRRGHSVNGGGGGNDNNPTVLMHIDINVYGSVAFIALVVFL